MSATLDTTEPTLRAEMRTTARARILRAAMAVLAERGLRSTVDDVAVAAGISRRTVFRHFSTHTQLFMAAVNAIGDEIAKQSAPPPPPEGGVRPWLTEVATTFHTMSQDLVGRAFWDIYITNPDTSPELAEVIGERRAYRRIFGETIAKTAWRAQGGTRNPPEWLIDTFVMQLSGFAFNSMIADRPRTPAETGPVSGEILWAALTTAVAEQAEHARRSAATGTRRRVWS